MATSGPGNLRARRDFGSRLRARRGRTPAKAVGDAIGVTAAQVTRIETGDRTCTDQMFDRFVELYGIEGQDLVDLRELLEQARDETPPWWYAFGEVVSANYATVLEYEADARLRRDYQPVLIPAHLQTEAYSREVTSLGWSALGPDQIDSLVEVRSMRQRRLYEPKPLFVEAVITQAAVTFEVGGPEAHLELLDHLLEITKLPNVDLRIIPYTAGAGGTHTGAFNVFSYDGGDPDVAFSEGVSGSVFMNDPRDLVRVNRLFKNLGKVALSADDTRALIKAKRNRT
ncbi:helix-turn-helix domain-containing protein [Embleya sp. NPDC059237]|uniref:helix-turn-helix domain-containing protein n=1 Tax=unclassified Embleya TaxID=2699296 RepID=UPI00369E87C0